MPEAPTITFDPSQPCTRAVRHHLATPGTGGMIADLLFLERWEMSPAPGAGPALRIAQIRRANPELAAAVRAELTRPTR
jgi:hypothetical protein